MKSLMVTRTHSSPYHNPNFELNERTALEKISGISYENYDKLKLPHPNILITNTHTRLKDLPRDLLKETKLIIHSNSGYDNFACDLDLWRSIPVIIGHEIRSQAVAEYCLNSLFTGLQELPQHLSWNKSRTWNRPLIKGQNILIFGFGHIGEIVASTLKTLGAKITVIDPFVPEHLKTWKEVNLTSVRAVIACCGLNSSSINLFEESFFNNCNPELVFINAARGKLVKEQALKEFLISHPQAQAFLDVFEQEPFDESWRHFPQVWKTSHIAGVYSGLDEAIIKFEEKVLTDFVTMDEKSFNIKYNKVLLQNKWINGELI